MNPKWLLAISFIEGGAVMGVELIGAKMIGPYFGASLYVWSAVLAVTLLGLTAGYYCGGIVSEKWPGQSTLFYLLAAGGLLTGIMPITAPPLMNMLLEQDFRIGAITSAFLFIFPPLLFYGMVSPFIVHMLTKQIRETGKKAGLVYAVSTLGGILFTFLIGFYVIPELGLRLGAVIISSIVLAVPVVCLATQRKTKRAFALLIVGILSAATQLSAASGIAASSDVFQQLYSSSGLLGQVTVYDYKNTDTRCVFINNVSQSYIDNQTGRSQWLYIHRLAAYCSFKPIGSRTLIVGLAAGNLVNEMVGLGFEMDACDIDKRMAHVASTYFGMTDRVSVTIDDARHFINVNKKTYDIIVLDISSGETQPTNLYTVEGFKKIKTLMAPDGILWIHYPTIYNGPEGLALKSIWKTAEASGLIVELVDTDQELNGLSEYLIFCTRDGQSLENQSFERRDPYSDSFGFHLSAEEGILRKDLSNESGIIMTDDRPIMDKLHSPMATRHRKASIDMTLRALRRDKIPVL